MKRKADAPFMNTRSKRPVLFPLKPTPIWVSGTDIRNYMRGDPLVDWLKLTKTKKTTFDPFSTFITERGKNFEKSLVSYIHTHIHPIVSISEKITDETIEKTKQEIQKGTPLIHSAPFINTKNHTRGVVDFLVRSDYLHLFTKEPKNLTIPFYYFVLDIKFSTLPLRSDGVHLLNSGNYPSYKAQLWIYNQGIGELQNYTPRYAYILGRRHSYVKNGHTFNSLDCLDKLGVIDYEGVDSSYKERTDKAIRWIRDVKQYGKRWKVSPPSRQELYPNMCIDSGVWNAEKKEIAETIGDITQLWYCGTKNRKIALHNGITSWRDRNCSANKIGVNGTRASTVDKIIEINRQEVDKIRPKKVSNNLYNWKVPENEIFVDFETFTDIFASFEELPAQPRTDLIFMVGVYDENGYRNFISKENSLSGERDLLERFVQFVKEKGYPKMWHWHADCNIWERAVKRQRANWKLTNWADLCQVFRSEPIVVKDCFKFGLKEISRAMKQHGLITTELTARCHSGIDASVTAWKAYQEKCDVEKDSRIRDIGIYNEFDVKVLWDMLNYLRRELV
jgi:hypothetical protein